MNLGLLAILAGALVAHLWPEWSRDPDLSHGFLMPAACLMLLYLCRRNDAAGSLPGLPAALLAGAFGAAALALLWVAGLLAASLDWSSPIVDFSLATAFALAGAAAIAAFADRGDPRIPFAWPSLAAAVIWPLSSPLPPGTYTRLTLGLQLWVSSGVMRTLDILGIAAHREGNIIELARGTVGIEEACSGVRSLVSCIFAGILFSAALVRRPWARVALFALSAPLALAMNFARSLALTLMVNAGIRVEGAWHDATGYAVLLVTAALLAALAVALDGTRSAPLPPAPAAAPGGCGRAPVSQRVLSFVLVAAAATAAFFALNTVTPVQPSGPSPELLSILPSSVPGWQVRTRTDLSVFSGTLRTNDMAERTYVRSSGDDQTQVTLYLAHWRPGQASVGLVGSHTPDACWPGSGWVAASVADPLASLAVGGRALPPAQHRLFTNGGYPQHVWFWQLYGGHPVDVGNTHSVRALVAIALHYGFRQGAEQYFVRLSANRDWGEISREPFVAEFFGRLRPLGLY